MTKYGQDLLRTGDTLQTHKHSLDILYTRLIYIRYPTANAPLSSIHHQNFRPHTKLKFWRWVVCEAKPAWVSVVVVMWVRASLSWNWFQGWYVDLLISQLCLLSFLFFYSISSLLFSFLLVLFSVYLHHHHHHISCTCCVISFSHEYLQSVCSYK